MAVLPAVLGIAIAVVAVVAGAPGGPRRSMPLPADGAPTIMEMYDEGMDVGKPADVD